jgi:predicted enzyme related to lactoylglutathione lyase
MNAPAYNTVAWFQVGTTDAGQAKRFYSDLFGWRYTLDPNSEGKYHLVSYPGGRCAQRRDLRHRR